MPITLNTKTSSHNIITTYIVILITSFTMSAVKAESDTFPTSTRAEQAILSTKASLIKDLRNKNLKYGSPIFIRIFKNPGILEVWVENQHEKFVLFKTYDICNFSGTLGPKIRQGDKQSPEGFYFVTKNQLNPWSRFHLSFNIGYPNAYDRYHGRTGNYLMVHGNCVSIGCYAMTDEYINEIYTMASAALKNRQSFFRVHIFPFKLTNSRLENYKDNPSYSFWLALKEGYDFFATHKRPPNIEVKQGRYSVSDKR